MKIKTVIGSIVLGAAAVCLYGCGGSDSAVESQPVTVTGKYLMAFHACNTSLGCSDPSNHMVFLAQSDDGADWTLVPGFTSISGSVPDCVRRGNTLYYFAGGDTIVRYRFDTGRWDSAVQGSYQDQTGKRVALTDITPLVDENGMIVLFFFLGVSDGGDPASCADLSSCPREFLSATEVAGSDGTQFVVDDGVRYLANGGSDPDVFKDKNGYVMYLSHGANVEVVTSPTLRGLYSPIAALSGKYLAEGLGGVPGGHYDDTTGQYWTYVHRTESGAGANQQTAATIRRAVHSSLDSQLTAGDFTEILTGAGVSGLGSSYTVESPGFAINQP